MLDSIVSNEAEENQETQQNGYVFSQLNAVILYKDNNDYWQLRYGYNINNI